MRERAYTATAMHCLFYLLLHLIFHTPTITTKEFLGEPLTTFSTAKFIEFITQNQNFKFRVMNITTIIIIIIIIFFPSRS